MSSIRSKLFSGIVTLFAAGLVALPIAGGAAPAEQAARSAPAKVDVRSSSKSLAGKFPQTDPRICYAVYNNIVAGCYAANYPVYTDFENCINSANAYLNDCLSSR